MEKPMRARMKDEGGRMKMATTHFGFRFILHPSSFLLTFTLLALAVNFSAGAQTGKRSGAHSSIPRDSFTTADRNTIEKAIGTACAERVRDPLGSTPIDEMQARPSLSASNPDAV